MDWKKTRDNGCPCKGCKKREPGTGCHDRCEEYQRWKEAERKLKEEEKRVHGINTMSDTKRKAIWKASLYRNRANKAKVNTKD